MKIAAIGSYIPNNTVDNLKQGEKFGESADFIEKKIGALQLSRLEDNEDTSDMAVKAVKALLATSNLTIEKIEALIVVTQNGDGNNLPHTSALVHAKLGLSKNVAVFDISLGCSGYVYGLQILSGFMQASGMRNSVLVTADPYSKVIDMEDRITSLLFGDAATATWLSAEGQWQLSRALMCSDGSGANSIAVTDGRLKMNGRQVFNFAATTVPRHIKDLLKQESLVETDIDQYCLHQGSAAIIDTISKRFPEVRNRFILDLKQQGNTVSSSIPLLLEKRINQKQTNRIFICGFGVGLSWASMILTKREV